MRIFYESFALCVRNSWRMKSVGRFAIGCITLVLISWSLIHNALSANIDWRLMKDVSLNNPPIDVVASFDGSYIFILMLFLFMHARKIR